MKTQTEQRNYEVPNLVETRKSGYINDTEALEVDFYKNLCTNPDEHRSRYNPTSNSVLDTVVNLETDAETIRERQRIFKTILANRDSATEIAGLRCSDIPHSYHSLQEYSEQGTNFYDNLRRTVELLDATDCNGSTKLPEAKAKLERMLGLEEGEEKLVSEIVEDARKSQRLFGNMSLTYRKDRYSDPFEVQRSEGYGFRLYPMSEKDNNHINEVPEAVERDVKRHIGENCPKEIFEYLSKVGFNVDYAYTEDGLKVRVQYDDSHSRANEKGGEKLEELRRSTEELFERENYVGDKKASFLANIREKIKRNRFIGKMKGIALEEITSKNRKLSDQLSGEINSEATDSEFLTASLNTIINARSEELKPYEEARAQFNRFRGQVKDYNDVAGFFAQKQNEGYPICFPEISECGERRVLISNLHPVRLITNGLENVVSSDVDCNGKPNVVTGPNAGGKSIYIVSVNDALVLAQAGLPIFAEKGEISVKDALFLHFIKNGDAKIGQSTFENSLSRFKDILSNVPNYRNPHITIDELAAGTDPQSAYDVSQRLVKTLVKLGSRASSNIVTQFGDVAKMAKEEYDVNTLQVDGNYRVVEGIGKAKGLELANRLGLTEEFCSEILEQSKN